MTIIVFLIDTSASMNQRAFSSGHPTLLDVAKTAVETFVKVCRPISPNQSFYSASIISIFLAPLAHLLGVISSLSRDLNSFHSRFSRCFQNFPAEASLPNLFASLTPPVMKRLTSVPYVSNMTIKPFDLLCFFASRAVLMASFNLLCSTTQICLVSHLGPWYVLRQQFSLIILITQCNFIAEIPR